MATHPWHHGENSFGQAGATALITAVAIALCGMLCPTERAARAEDDVDSSEIVSRVVDKIGRFRAPSRIALTDDGRIFVSDTAQGVVAVHDIEGMRVGTLRGVGEPLGVAVRKVDYEICQEVQKTKHKRRRRWPRAAHDPADKIKIVCSTVELTLTYVGDGSDGKVKIFVNDTYAVDLGPADLTFQKPNAIAITAEMIYVVDSAAHQVAAFTLNGAFLGSFGSQGDGDGELDFPTDIAVNEALNEVYVSDWRNGRIAVFGMGGTFLHNIAAPLNDGGDPIFHRPSGLGIDPDGNIYVVDNTLSCVVVMDACGELVDAFGYQSGSYWTGELDVPVDAVSDGVFVYVTSSGEGHVNVFEVTP